MSASVPDLSPFFSQYETLASQVDALFTQVKNAFPDEVTCKQGCSSCCHAMFDLSLVEALYLNHKFLEFFPQGAERSAIINKADTADRQAAKVKRKLYQGSRSGKDSSAVLTEAARADIRCPLLGKDEECLLYAVRPLTCRLYGVPTSIGGRAHSCGKTGFSGGTQYPTVNMDAIQERLLALSAELVLHLGTSYKALHTMYVPVSTVLITSFTASYLGIGGIPKESDA